MSTGTAVREGVRSTAAPGAGRPGPRQFVTAVLVVHDGARWLPRTLAAMAACDRRPDRVVAVDVGSTDRSATLLQTAATEAGGEVVDEVVEGRRTDGLGTSVARGLQAADLLLPQVGAAQVEHWVWLLHDDSAPEPGALAALLAAVAVSPAIALAGCKQRDWADARRLVEVGITLSWGGRRISDVGSEEPDQGQHDHRGDVLAVSTAGMLVRRDVWDALGGLDPSLPLVGEDVDLCLRVRRAGHRVAVVPEAVVRHAMALQVGLRRPDALRPGWMRRLLGPPETGDLVLVRRRRAIHLRLVHCHLLAVLPVLAWVVLAAPVRATGWLVRRRGRSAGAELFACLTVLCTPSRVVRGRLRARRGRVVGAGALRPMLRSRRAVLREDLDGWRLRAGHRRQARADGLGGPTDAAEPVRSRRVVGHPLTYLLPALLVLGWALGATPTGASAFPGPWAVDGLTAADQWARVSSSWRDVGVGMVGTPDPASVVWAGLTALLSILTTAAAGGSSLGQVHDLLVVTAPALSLVVACPLLHRLTGSRAAAMSIGLLWAVLPWTGLVGPSTPGTLLVHLLLPAAAAAMLGCVGHRAVRSTGLLGLLTCLLVALVPALWPVLLWAAVLVGVVGGARASASLRAVLPVVAVSSPLLVWASWAGEVVARPRLLLLDPAALDASSRALPALLGTGTSGQVADLAETVGPGSAVVPVQTLVAVLLGVVLLVVLLVCTACLARRRRVASWSIASVGASAAVLGAVAARSQVRLNGEVGAGPWSAVWLALLVLAALLVRAVLDAGPSPHDARRRLVQVRSLVVVGVLVPLAASTAVVLLPLLGPAPLPARGLPLPAAVDAGATQQARTLVLDVSVAPGADEEPVVTWTVGRAEPGPGQDSTAAALDRAGESFVPAAGQERLREVVGALLAAGTDTADVPTAPAADLARLGIGWVVVDSDDAELPARTAVEDALGTRDGLVATSTTVSRSSWRVAVAPGVPPPARARVVEPDGAVTAGVLDIRNPAVLAAGVPGRLLVLAEAADPAWAANVDGVALRPTTVDGWAQGFLLPAGAGELRVQVPGQGAAPATAATLVVLALLSGAALWPGRGRRVRPLAARAVRPDTGSATGRGVRLLGRSLVAAAVTSGLLLGVVTGSGAVPGLAGWAGTAAGGPGAAESGAAEPGAADLGAPGPTLALASPTARVACPGATAGIVADGGSASDADPGVMAVLTGEDMAALPLAQDVADDARRGLQLGVVTAGDLRGATLTGCARAAVTSWVPLSGTAVGESPTVVLDNPGDTAAVADVSVLTEQGEASRAATGLVVPAGQRVSVSVAALAADAEAVVVEVVASTGSVAVTGVDTAIDGLVPQGRAELAAVGEAATDVVVPAVVVAGGERSSATVRIGAVGTEPGTVTVTPVGPDGPVDLGRAGVVVVAGRTVRDVALDGLPPGTYSMRLSADVPVVAAGRWSGGRDGEPLDGLTGVPMDRAWVTGEPGGSGWTEPFSVAWPGLAGADAQVALALSGDQLTTETGTQVEVEVVDQAGGSLAVGRVDVSSGTGFLGLSDLLVAEAAAGGDAPAAVVVRVPDGSVLHAALIVSVSDPDGDLLAGTTVAAPPAPTGVVTLRRG